MLAEYESEDDAEFSVAPPPKTPKRKRKFLGLGLGAWLLLAFAGMVAFSMSNYKSPAERLEELRLSDPAAYAAQVAENEAEAAAQAERDRLAAERRQQEQAAAGEAERQRVAAKAAEEAEERRKGFHCLSGWDGSHRGLIDWTKENLNDPGSFEHDETRITPVNDQGQHSVIMKYRAKNGFGGVVRGSILAVIRQSDCALVEIVSSS